MLPQPPGKMQIDSWHLNNNKTMIIIYHWNNVCYSLTNQCSLYNVDSKLNYFNLLQ